MQISASVVDQGGGGGAGGLIAFSQFFFQLPLTKLLWDDGRHHCVTRLFQMRQKRMLKISVFFLTFLYILYSSQIQYFGEEKK